MTNQLRPILVADPDESFYERFRGDPLLQKISFEIVSSGGKVQQIIKDKRNEFTAVLVSPEILSPSGLSIVKCSMSYQPLVPIIFLESMHEDIEGDYDDYRSLGITKILAKPFEMKDLAECIGPALKLFDADKAIEMSGQFKKDKLDEESDAGDKDFRPIQANLFISGSKSLFDVYIKIRAGKFIKVLQAGDKFDYERLLEYLNKGVQFFYIRKETQESYLTYCDTLTNNITKNKSITTEKKFGFLLNQAEVTINTLHDLGVDNKTIQYAQKYTKNVLSFVEGVANKSELLSSFLKELSKFEHSSSVVVVASMISKYVGVETDKNAEILGTAALIHDIGLKKKVDSSDLYAFDDPSKSYIDEGFIVEKLKSGKVFGEEKNSLTRLYSEHPRLGAELSLSIEGISSIVPQLIQQHHSVEDKENKKLPLGIIHPLAEVIEISDQFVHTLKRYSGKNIDKVHLAKAFSELANRFPQRVRIPFKQVFKFIK